MEMFIIIIKNVSVAVMVVDEMLYMNEQDVKPYVIMKLDYKQNVEWLKQFVELFHIHIHELAHHELVLYEN
jgi:hypothetical protein